MKVEEGSTATRRSQARAVARGGGFLAGGTLFEYANRFVIGLLLARLLGPEDYGLYHLAISAATMFAGIASLGLDAAMVRYVAILSGRKDRPGVWGTIQIGLGVAVPVSLLMGGVLYVVAPLVAVGLFDEPALTPALRLMAFVVPVLTLSDVLLGVARGFGRMDHASFGENVVQSVVRIVLLAILALVGLDLVSALVVFAVADMAASVALGVLTNRHFPLRPSEHREVRRDARGVFRFALPLWVSGLLRQFQKDITKLVLGVAAAPASVGIFAIVAHVNLVGQAAYRSVVVAVKPLLAQMHDQEDRGGLQYLYTTTARWLLMTNIPFFLGMVLYPSSILVIFGEAYSAGAAALMVMATAELVQAGTGICGSLIDMTGHTRAKLANSILWLAVAAVANVILVPPYGVVGAALAYGISITVVNVARMAELWFLERVFPSWRAYLKPGLAGAAALGFGYGLQEVLPIGSRIWPAVGQGMLVVGVYAAILWLLGVEEEDRDLMARMGRKVWKRT